MEKKETDRGRPARGRCVCSEHWGRDADPSTLSAGSSSGGVVGGLVAVLAHRAVVFHRVRTGFVGHVVIVGASRGLVGESVLGGASGGSVDVAVMGTGGGSADRGGGRGLDGHGGGRERGSVRVAGHAGHLDSLWVALRVLALLVLCTKFGRTVEILTSASFRRNKPVDNV